jgi:hypothetical protein
MLSAVLIGSALAMTVLAEGPGASATAHARDELANCLAQHRPECPTPTPVLTATPRPLPPMSTPIPDASATPAPIPTSLPALLLPDWENGVSAYLRPSSWPDAAPEWQELALPWGRWDVQSDCPRGGWFNVHAWQTPQGAPALVDVGEQWGCTVSLSVWHSDVPCAISADDICDFTADSSWIIAQSAAAPEPATVVVTTAPTNTARPANLPPPVAAPPVPQVVYVYVPGQTPIDTPTPWPTQAPVPTSTLYVPPTNTPRATVTPVVATATIVASPTAAPAPSHRAAAAPEAALPRQPHPPEPRPPLPSPNGWDFVPTPTRRFPDPASAV